VETQSQLARARQVVAIPLLQALGALADVAEFAVPDCERASHNAYQHIAVVVAAWNRERRNHFAVDNHSALLLLATL